MRKIHYAERLLSKFKVNSTTECWEYTGHLSEKGYGLLEVGNRDRKTHRLMWVLTQGPIPEGAMVLHKCRSKRCMNPMHLKLGNAQMNANDRENDGNTARGISHGGSKLTAVLVKHIRKSRSSHAKLSKILSVDEATIRNIRNHKTWKHIA